MQHQGSVADARSYKCQASEAVFFLLMLFFRVKYLGEAEIRRFDSHPISSLVPPAGYEVCTASRRSTTKCLELPNAGWIEYICVWVYIYLLFHNFFISAKLSTSELFQ